MYRTSWASKVYVESTKGFPPIPPKVRKSSSQVRSWQDAAHPSWHWPNTSWRFALCARDACLVVGNPTFSVSACSWARGSVVLRLRLCMSMPPRPHAGRSLGGQQTPPPYFVIALTVHEVPDTKRGVSVRTLRGRKTPPHPPAYLGLAGKVYVLSLPDFTRP